DTEVIVHLMAQSSSSDCMDKIIDAVNQLRGGFALIFLVDGKVFAVRDRHGLRPLVMAEKSGVHVVASESCALDLLDIPYQRDVRPGELVCIDQTGRLTTKQIMPRAKMAFCSFEPIYFSRPDSLCGGRSIYEMRKRIGAVLARLYPVKADAVIAVPDSATPIAIGYAEATGIPLELGMIRNHYIGRTFIQPSQTLRDLGVKLKFNALEEVLSGNDCVVIDDSIVRGTTSLKIVRMLRKAGAQKIHFRVGSPPVTHSCHYGISTPDRQKLMAAQFDVDHIREELDVDSLGYLTREGLAEALDSREYRKTEVPDLDLDDAQDSEKIGYCMACFSGDYPVVIDDPRAYESHPTDKGGCGYFSEKPLVS
ncbi:MAG: amidophosphoribosyltransferase, partial [Proteobacteria bacterium]|nr:amidophosphoribosyltransferase [Pseudomonadota bacterium]